MFSRKSSTKEYPMSNESQPSAEHWRLREAVGRYGSFVIVSGTIIKPVLLSLIIALWIGKKGDTGEFSSPEWRYIILNNWVTEAVTLLSMGIRIASSLQSLICTALAAATILETTGVPVSQVAEVSVMRGVNDGPWRLVYLTLSSSWKKMFSIQPLLVVMLYLTTLATQLGSTLLVTDLETTAIMGEPNSTFVNVTLPLEALNTRQTAEVWSMPPTYETFGEVPSGLSPQPSSQGVSDTGNIKRFFLPVTPENRKSTRYYKGPAYAWNNRVTCIPPSASGGFEIGDPGYRNFPFLLNFLGNISYEKSFANAGMPQPALCAGGRCLPKAFNCSIITTRYRGREAFTLCVPDVSNVADPNTWQHWSDGRVDPVNANSMVWLMLRNNGTYNDWADVQRRLRLPDKSRQQAEWTQWDATSDVSFSASMCFYSEKWEISHVEMSSPTTPVPAKPDPAPGNYNYDTQRLREQLGATQKNLSIAERGIFAVDKVWNITTGINSTTYFDLGSWYLVSGSSSARMMNISYTMFGTTLGRGAAWLNPYVDYSGTFEDVLLDTNRPALALQAMMGIRSANTYYNTIARMRTEEEALVTSAVFVQVPVHFNGLIIFMAIIAINFVTVVGILWLFLLRTHHSKQGHFWHTISQIISEDTVPLLHNSTNSRDDRLMKKHLEEDHVMVLRRCAKTGRIQIIKTRDDNSKMGHGELSLSRTGSDSSLGKV